MRMIPSNKALHWNVMYLFRLQHLWIGLLGILLIPGIANADCDESDTVVDGIINVEVSTQADGSSSVTVDVPAEVDGRVEPTMFLGLRTDSKSIAALQIAANRVGDRYYADFVLSSSLLSTSTVLVAYSTDLQGDPSDNVVCSSSTIE